MSLASDDEHKQTSRIDDVYRTRRVHSISGAKRDQGQFDKISVDKCQVTSISTGAGATSARSTRATSTGASSTVAVSARVRSTAAP